MSDVSHSSTNPLIKLVLDQIHEIRGLRAGIADVTADRDTYREIAREGMHALADLTKRHRQTTERYRDLLNEARALRAQIREAA